MKKGQVETMGLMIIVVLILVLGVIFLSFALREKPDLSKEVQESVQTNSLLTALLQTTLDGKPLKEKFPECYNNRQLCDNLASRIGFMLNLTVQPGKNYEFKLSADDEDLISLGKCRYGAVSATPIRRENINFLVNLKMC